MGFLAFVEVCGDHVPVTRLGSTETTQTFATTCFDPSLERGIFTEAIVEVLAELRDYLGARGAWDDGKWIAEAQLLRLTTTRTPDVDLVTLIFVDMHDTCDSIEPIK
jgi:hypothetical protein